MAYTKKTFFCLLTFCLLASFLNAAGQGEGEAQAQTTQTQGSLNQGRAMSQDATAEMDRAFGNQSAGTQSAQKTNSGSGGAQAPTAVIAPAASAGASGGALGVPPPTITKDKNGKPNWADMSDNAYSRQYYISAVGYATSRPAAEAKAFGNLTALFGQSVSGNFSAVETLKERISDGIVSVQLGQDIKSAVESSSSMDQLIGAEIGDRWEDKSTKPVGYYAVAFMEIPKTIKIYSDLIDSNVALINKAINLPPADKTSFEGIIRYQFAASLADANEVFATVLSVIGGPDKKGSLTQASDYRYEASNIARKVPINVVVKNDENGRLKAAFAAVFSGMGFRTGSNSSRYVLNATLAISPVALNNQNKFSRFEITANLIDTTNNTTLMPYSVNGREGHTTQSEADQRALRAAESKVKEEYAENLEEFLASAVPKK
ncbi:MAG: LPP20 family lipoprotein [Spirochaetaceae bacterium]|jgi:hypothetical protein|nr:LPP20 family lipoprotein [Spirochaetaceae bacterium]